MMERDLLSMQPGQEKLAAAAEISQEHLRSVVAVQIALVMDVVNHGGSFRIQGNVPPLCSPGTPRYQARLSSPSGARYASAEGDELQTCLHQLLILWGKQ